MSETKKPHHDCPANNVCEANRLRVRIAELEADLKESTERGDIYKKSFYQAQQRAEAAELADTMTECTRLRKGWAVCHERLVKVCMGMVATYADPKTHEVSYHLAQEILKELKGGGDE